MYFTFILESEGIDLHAQRGNNGWGTETRSLGTYRRSDAHNDDRDEGPRLHQVYECLATG